jgi:restriction system protein
MTEYNRIMAGAKSVFAAQCVAEGFIGVDFGIAQDLRDSLPEDWREFNHRFIPVYLQSHPEKTKIGAGLACGFTWTVAKGLKRGDVVITPNGNGRYHAGEITGEYFYASNEVLPHRRPVTWFPATFERANMSAALQRSTNSVGTCCDIRSGSTNLNNRDS